MAASASAPSGDPGAVTPIRMASNSAGKAIQVEIIRSHRGCDCPIRRHIGRLRADLWLCGSGRCYRDERPDPLDGRSWQVGPADRVEDLLVGQVHYPLVRLGILADLRNRLLV